MKKICIVGGGIIGMSAASILADRGYNVTLMESSNKLGGLASAWDNDIYKWDKFYHVILLSDLYTRKLIEELNLSSEMNFVETKTGIFDGLNIYKISGGIDFIRIPILNLIEKIRLVFTILYASRINNWKKLEKILVEEWLNKISGKSVFRKFWQPLLNSKLGESYQKTSASFIWTTIQRLFSARKNGLEKEKFGYINGGYKTVINEFEKSLVNKGVKVFKNHNVKNISKSLNNIHIITNNGEYEFDEVIMTIPSDFISNICSDISSSEIDQLANIDYLGVVCASVIVSKPLSGCYVMNIMDEEIPFTGLIEMTSLVKQSNFGGNQLIYLPKYVQDNSEYYIMNENDIKEIFLKGLFKIYPYVSKEDIVEFKVAKAKRVFSIPTIDQSKKIPKIKTSVDGLYIINSSQILNGTQNINENLKHVEKCIEEIYGKK